MIYRFDPNKWALHQLPPLLWQPRIYSLLKALLVGVCEVYDSFMAYKEDVSRKITYNGYTVNLERFLNETFCLDDEITIEDYRNGNVFLHRDNENADEVYVSMKSEGDEFLLPSSKPDDIIGGFKIIIPETLDTEDSLAIIRKWVEYYRPAGTSYKIETYG